MIRDLAKEGKMEQLLDEYPKEGISAYRTLKQIKFDFAKKPTDLPDVCGIWIHGQSGIGKSFTVRKEHPVFYDKMLNKWWDNYNGEDVVLYEDVDLSSAYLGNFLKRAADRYPFPVEIKNHVTMIRPKIIIVTSQHIPKEIWPNDPELVEAITRRFKMRGITMMDRVDTTSSKKKSVKRSLTTKDESIIASKKPRLYHQNANGVIEINTQPVVQQDIEKSIKSTSKLAKTQIILPDSDSESSEESMDLTNCSPNGYCNDCGIHLSICECILQDTDEDSDSFSESSCDY